MVCSVVVEGLDVVDREVVDPDVVDPDVVVCVVVVCSVVVGAAVDVELDDESRPVPDVEDPSLVDNAAAGAPIPPSAAIDAAAAKSRVRVDRAARSNVH